MTVNCPICQHGYRAATGDATIEHLVDEHGLTEAEGTAIAIANIYGLLPTIVTDDVGTPIAIAIQLPLPGA